MLQTQPLVCILLWGKGGEQHRRKDMIRYNRGLAKQYKKKAVIAEAEVCKLT